MIEVAIGLFIGISITALCLSFAFVYAVASQKQIIDVTAHLSDADRDLLQKLVSLLERDNNRSTL